MDSNNDKMTSTLLKCEVLEKEYENILNQYQEALNNYINLLQTNSTSNGDNTSSVSNYAQLNGRAWWGTSGLKEGSVATVGECESMCASDEKCTGATFNPVKRYCWARQGDGRITTGLDSDIALIPKQKEALVILNSLNERLLNINQQLNMELSQLKPQATLQQKEKNMKQQQLTIYYEKLLDQKRQMEKQLNEYRSINEDLKNENLYTTQENVSFRFWVLITIVVIILTIRFMFGKQPPPFPVLFWIIMFILMIILTFVLRVPSGFMIWGFVLTLIILMRTGYLPSP